MNYSWYKLTILCATISFCCFINTTLLASPSNIEGIQIYQKNIHLSPERKEKLAADIDRYNNADNLWDALRQEFTLPHYEDNPRVQAQIEWFMNNQDFLYRSAMRASPYLYYILQQVRKRHLPAEVALLPVFESSFNPFAYSPAGAAGIWQMMPGTASGYGIKQNWWYDGRRDVLASTNAALNYLAYLGEFFDGNWLYAIAAYNTGEGNVVSAIKRNASIGNSTDFWSLPVAQETQDYIPKLLALATIVSHPDIYPVQLPYVRNAPYLAQIDIGTQIDLQHAADLAGLSFKDLKHLNPGYNRIATDPIGPSKLVLPIEAVEQFSENLEKFPTYQQTNWAHYKIKSSENLRMVAKKFNTTPAELQKINPELASNHHLKRGTNILIPKSGTSISKTILDSAPIQYVSSDSDSYHLKHKIHQAVSHTHPDQYTLQPGDTLYMVRDGDDIEHVAKRFHTSASTLLEANNLGPGTALIPGEQLIIPTHTENDDSKKFLLNPGDTLYMVRKGDTIEKIAKKYHTTASALRLANLLASNNVKEGDQIIVPTHA